MRIQVLIRLKKGVLDVQGKAVARGLEDLGYRGVEDLTIGRLIEFNVSEKVKDDAINQVRKMCEKIFANPIMEDSEIRVIE